jgi:hypothetical protein
MTGINVSFIDNNGGLVWSDIDCTQPAYRGPIPTAEVSQTAMKLYNNEYDPEALAGVFEGVSQWTG